MAKGPGVDPLWRHTWPTQYVGAITRDELRLLNRATDQRYSSFTNEALLSKIMVRTDLSTGCVLRAALLRAILYEELGRRRDAVKDYRRLLKMPGANPTRTSFIYHKYSLACLSFQEPVRGVLAANHCRSMTRTGDPLNIRASIVMARGLIDLGLRRKARTCVEMIADNPSVASHVRAEAMVSRAIAAIGQQDFKDAEKDLRYAINKLRATGDTLAECYEALADIASRDDGLMAYQLMELAAATPGVDLRRRVKIDATLKQWRQE